MQSKHSFLEQNLIIKTCIYIILISIKIIYNNVVKRPKKVPHSLTM